MPETSQMRITFSPYGLNILLSSIGLYLLPISIGVIIEKKIISLFLNLKKLDLIIFLVISTILFFTLPDSPKFEGVGVIYKILSLVANKIDINWNFILFIYYVFNLFFLLLILAFFKKNLKNYIFLITFSIIFVAISSTYQQYVDPIFFLLVFCYFNFVDQIKIFSVTYIITYFLFYFSMLFGAIYYRNVCSIYFLEAACKVQ